jgi:hypothetical protein
MKLATQVLSTTMPRSLAKTENHNHKHNAIHTYDVSMSQPSNAFCTQAWPNDHKMSTCALHKSPALLISLDGWLVGSQLLGINANHIQSPWRWKHYVPHKTLEQTFHTHVTSDFRQEPMKLPQTRNIFHQDIPGLSPNCRTGYSAILMLGESGEASDCWPDYFILIPTTHMNPLFATNVPIPVARPTHPPVKGTFYGGVSLPCPHLVLKKRGMFLCTNISTHSSLRMQLLYLPALTQVKVQLSLCSPYWGRRRTAPLHAPATLLRHGQKNLRFDAHHSQEIFSPLKHPGQLCGLPSFLFNAQWGSWQGGVKQLEHGRGVKWLEHGRGVKQLEHGRGIKWLEHGVDHSNPSSTEVMNEWSYASTPPICLHGMDRVNLTFTF